ncbi:MAG TPA: GNAT family N-acetyltransferase [Stellaceae bacterium]|jgi:ribosomal-protein-alanine N-acetyltransferase|nr:GNAT family N-acetyltransferase [Stellaceae bacterium]
MTRIAAMPVTAAEPMARLHLACFPDEPWDAEAFGRLLALPGCFGCIAWLRGTPIGFALARDLGTECEVLSLGVLPSQRRRGTGRQLVGAIADEATRRGLGSVVLEVATDNHAARRLYTALGFGRAGFRPRYYRRPDGLADALILRLRLNQNACLS